MRLLGVEPNQVIERHFIIQVDVGENADVTALPVVLYFNGVHASVLPVVRRLESIGFLSGAAFQSVAAVWEIWLF